MSIRWIAALVCLALAASSADLAPTLLAESGTSIYLGMKCPKSLQEWNLWRENFVDTLQSLEFIKMKRDALMFEHCENSPDQAQFFQNQNFATCMKNIGSAFKSLRAYSAAHEIGWEDGYIQASPPDLSDPVIRAFTSPFMDTKRVNQLSRSGLDGTDGSSPLDGTTGIRKSISEYLPVFKSRGLLFQEMLSRLQAGTRAMSYKAALIHKGGAIFVLPESAKDKNDYDQYMHISEDGSSLLQIAIKRRDSNGTPLNPPQIFFDAYRESGTGIMERSSPTHIGRCMVCHRAGAIPVIPTQPENVLSYTPDIKSTDILQWFNGVQVPKTANAVPPFFSWDMIGFPQLGSEDDHLRTDDFMKGCIKSSSAAYAPPSVNVEKLRKAMNCEKCHDGEKSGMISYPFAPADLDGKNLARHLIEGGLMPPKSDLNKDERVALASCLEAEYMGGFKFPPAARLLKRGAIKEYLLKVPCPTEAKRDPGLAPAACALKAAPGPADVLNLTQAIKDKFLQSK